MSDVERIRELEEALRQREARITELEREVTDKTKAIEAWKRGHRVRPGGRLAQKKPSKRKASGRGPGRAAGHPGAGRLAPRLVDREVDVDAATECPHCKGGVELSDEEPGSQLVEELIPARTEVVCYRRGKGRCRDCRAAVLAPLPGGLGSNPKIGVRAQAEIVQTKTDLGLTLGQTQKLFARQGLSLSRGGIQQILHRSAAILAPGKKQIRAEIPKATAAWADESSHKVSGRSGYLWLVMTRHVVLYEADRSRGQEVAQRILAGFKGTLHSDFYAVYWTLPGVAHAPCWGHLCRSAREVAERMPTATEPTAFHDRVSGLYARGVAGQGRQETSARNARAIKGDLKTLANDAELAVEPDVARLQRRIQRHLDELVAFITDPELEATNNRAEREFRPHAQARHRSGGARSDRGAQTYATNLSIVRTVQLNGGDFIQTFTKAREAFHDGGEFPKLFPLPKKTSPAVAALN